MGLPINFVVQYMELYDWNAITCKGTTFNVKCDWGMFRNTMYLEFFFAI